jgi:PEGA domain
VEARAARAIEAERQRADAHIARRDRIDNFVAASDAHGWDLKKVRARGLPRWARSAAAAVIVITAVGAAATAKPFRSVIQRVPALFAKVVAWTPADGATSPTPGTTTTNAEVPRPARRGNRTPAPAAAQQPAGQGLLAVSSRIPVDVLVKGRRIGTSDGGQMVLASGVHRLELVNRRFNYRGLVSVRVEPGGLTSHAVALPYGSVRVETTPGAEIWIEGQRMGEAPVDDLAVPIGTREVVVRNADRRERRQPIEVRVGEVAVVNAEFEPLANAAEAAAGMPTLQAPSLHIIR